MSITFKSSTKTKVNKQKFRIQPFQISSIIKKSLKLRRSSMVESTSELPQDCFGYGYNPLAGTIRKCFSDHKRLVLSPDMIWLNILQQLAIHVSQNSETLRKKFVSYEGKKVLEVRRDSFIKGQQNPWDNVFPEFSEQIKEHIGAENHNMLSCNFSTTTPIDKAACEIALMDVVSSYFDYLCSTLCGIPEITLEGNTEDWQELLNKTSSLRKFEVDFWLDGCGLKQLLEQFVYASQGKPDLDFWNSFFNENGGSGGPYMNGHFLSLFAYFTGYNGKIDKNSGRHSGMFDGVTTSSFTSGLSSVPFLWQVYDNVYPMSFSSGFIGTEQLEDGALRPCVAWAVSNREISGEELDKEVSRFSKELNAQGRSDRAQLLTNASVNVERM